MNQETISQEQYLFNQLTFEERKSIIELMKNITNLQQENRQLKDRIEKAIEYIENTRVDNNYMVQEKYEYLLEILKGEIQ